MTGPSGNSFNYSDAGAGGGIQPAMFWFAAKLKIHLYYGQSGAV